MSDFIYVLVTLVSFAGLALLVGVIDRRLAAADDLDEPVGDPSPAGISDGVTA